MAIREVGELDSDLGRTNCIKRWYHKVRVPEKRAVVLHRRGGRDNVACIRFVDSVGDVCDVVRTTSALMEWAPMWEAIFACRPATARMERVSDKGKNKKDRDLERDAVTLIGYVEGPFHGLGVVDLERGADDNGVVSVD
jgi:hypothetical protein